jgi:hypothetical protein
MFRNVKCRSVILTVVLCEPDDWSHAFRILVHERQELRKEWRKMRSFIICTVQRIFSRRYQGVDVRVM